MFGHAHLQLHLRSNTMAYACSAQEIRRDMMYTETTCQSCREAFEGRGVVEHLVVLTRLMLFIPLNNEREGRHNQMWGQEVRWGSQTSRIPPFRCRLEALTRQSCQNHSRKPLAVCTGKRQTLPGESKLHPSRRLLRTQDTFSKMFPRREKQKKKKKLQVQMLR